MKFITVTHSRQSE